MKCYNCGKADYAPGVQEETYTYRGKSHTFQQEGEYCPACGDAVFTEAQTREWDREVAAFRAKVDEPFLTAPEIRRIRRKLAITQQEAAQLFGGGVNAFSLYEKGKVRQHKSTDLLLRVLDRHPKLLAEIKSV